jgi:hypothetical protein
LNAVTEYVQAYREFRCTAIRDSHVGPAIDVPIPHGTIDDASKHVSSLVLDGSAAELERLSQFPALEDLWLQHAGPKELQRLAGVRSLRALAIRDLTAVDLAPLSSLSGLQHLVLMRAPRVRTLGPLATMGELQTLYLGDLRHVTDLPPLSTLVHFYQLLLHGGMWSNLRLLSLSPLARLVALKYLLCGSFRVLDKELRSLSQLHQLRYIAMPNVFPIEECAALAAALPHAQGRILRPIFDGSLDGLPPGTAEGCKKCEAFQVMTTGSPTKRLCPVCDPARLKRHLERWQALVAAT